MKLLSTLLFLIQYSSHLTVASPLSSRTLQIQYTISNNTVPLLSVNGDSPVGVFAAEVLIGTQLIPLSMDTGSSDTFVMSTNTSCESPTRQDQQCTFGGPKFKDGASFEVISNMNLNTSYGNGQRINGPLGRTDIVLGGLTISDQTISPASLATTTGVSPLNVSGIAGLAYPALTNAFPGSNASQDVICTGNASCGPVQYPPLITTLFKQNSIEPVFSFALSRGSTFGGLMTLGGIPHLDDPFINASTANIASSEIKPYGKSMVISLYTTQVEGLTFTNAEQGAGNGTYFVDTGTIPCVFPEQEAAAINALFDPSATRINDTGSYLVECNATAPRVGINIGGQVFYFNPKDLISRYNGTCYSSVVSSLGIGGTGRILGASWLKSVLAIFDVGESRMTFVGREFYAEF